MKLSFLFLVILTLRNVEGCLVVNPRSTTVTTTVATTTVRTSTEPKTSSESTYSTSAESSTDGSTHSTVSHSTAETSESTISQSTQSTDSTVSHSTDGSTHSTDSTVSHSTDGSTHSTESTGSHSTDGNTHSTDSTVSHSIDGSTHSTESTVSHSTGSTVSYGSTDASTDFTTTISTASGRTTDSSCKAYCNNPDNILIPDNTVFGKPISLKIAGQMDEICSTYMVSCDAPGGQYCDRIDLLASQSGSSALIQLANQDQVSVRGIVECTGNGVFRQEGEDGASGFYDMVCMYRNCRNGTVPTTTPETTTTEEPTTTTETKSCSTCEITDLFNYADRTDKFQPWYYDVADETACTCKAHDISCEIYNVDVCDSHKLLYLADDGLEYLLSETSTNKVHGEIRCQDNGEYGVDGRIIKEIYCKSTNCRNATAVTTTTVEPTTTELRNCKTCQVPSLFNYPAGSDYFQPWYRDIDGGNCNCKFNEISCEMFGNTTCANFNLEYTASDGTSGTITTSTTKKVVGQIDCQDNGYYEIGGKILNQVYCQKYNCV